MKLRSIIIAATRLVLTISVGHGLSADTFIVTNTNDSGPGSLRQAIIDANENAWADSIVFHLPLSDHGYDSRTGVWTIKIQSSLPALIDDQTLIDGTTQTEFLGFDPNPDGPEIELNACMLDTTSSGAIQISSGGNTIKGLIVNRSATVGILISSHRSNNGIYGNYIGTDPTGSQKRGNRIGIKITDPDYFNNGNNYIGGLLQGHGNIISGNVYGIEIQDSGNNTITENLIGLGARGAFSIPNDSCAILIKGNSNTTKIGPANKIYKNDGYGICCQTQHGTFITGNEIVSNGKSGIYLDGGTLTVTQNLIQNNMNGVYVNNCASVPTIENNTITDNLSVGIVIRNIENAGGGWHNNNICANQTFGVYSDAHSSIVNAQWNWWGHESGPNNPETNPDGRGNAVSRGVEYRPWQTGYVSVIVEAISSEYQTFGGSSKLKFLIMNIGNVMDTYSIYVSDSLDWYFNTTTMEVSIDANADTTLSFIISSPSDSTAWIRNSVYLTITSHLTTATDSDSLSVLAGLSGDVNGDGIVNILDAVLVANCVICCWDPIIMYFGDCNRDDFFNILDLLGIVNQILGISACNP